MATSCPVRFTMMTFWMLGQDPTAESAIPFRSTILPLLHNPSDVTRIFASRCLILSARASLLNPEYTCVKGTPILEHASMAMGSSGIMGI